MALVAAGGAHGRAQPAEGTRLVLDAEAVWSHAEALFRAGEYYRAITEYLRLQHFFPASARATEARLRIGAAYLLGGEPGEAIRHADALLEAAEPAAPEPALRYLRGLARLELDRAAPYTLREAHVAQALEDLRAIPPAWSPAPRDFARALEQPPALPDKSPWLAAGLSALLPGAGSAYVGDYPEAALALFVNALFIGATVQAFEHDHDDAGIVLGVAALAFYGGAIYAAANGAHRFNDRARSDYLDAQRTRFGLVVRPNAVTAMLERRF